MSVDEELVLLAERLFNVQMQIDALLEAKAGLENAIIARRREGAFEIDSKTLVRIKPPGKRFNEKKAKEALKDEMLPEYMDFSGAKLKKIDPDLYESFREANGSPSVEIVSKND